MAENNSNNEQSTQEQQPYPEAPPPSKGQRKALKVILIVLAVFFILGILGAALLAFFGAKIGENIIEDVTNTQIENTGDGVTVETEDGSSFSVGAELPNDFPETVPLFEPSELSSSSSSKSGDGKIWTASFITDASQAEVTSFYENEFSGDEWEVSSSFSGGGSNQTHYVNEAEETRIGVIVQSADEDDGETTFTLSVTQNQE